MSNIFLNLFLWLVPVAVSFYTFTYARWLLKQKNKRGALGVAVLAFLTAFYPGMALFLI